MNNLPDPSLQDVLDLTKKEVMLRLNCHAIATVKKFDSAKQTVTAKINYDKTFYKQQGTKQVPYLVPYPLLVDCPVLFLGGGVFSLTFPIKEGDQCLILFNDRDMDNWIAGARSGGPATDRLHSLSDGIALVGLNKIGSFDTTRAGISNGNARVLIGESLVKIANNSETLKALLTDLITQVKALVTATAGITVPVVVTVDPVTHAGGGTGGPPVNAATITAVGTQLTAISTRIAGLLE